MTKKQSTLPEYMEEKTIATMKTGDTGYTFTHTLFVTDDRLLWINGNFTVYSILRGSAPILIKRTEAGVEVQESTIGNETFKVNENRHRNRTGPAPFPLPVFLVKEIKLKGDNDDN